MTPMPVPPQGGAPAPGPAAPAAPAQGGGAAELVAKIHSDLSRLAAAIGKSQAAGPELAAKAQALLNGLEDLVQDLSQPSGPAPAPGGAPAPAPAGPVAGAPAMRPEMAGRGPVRPA